MNNATPTSNQQVTRADVPANNNAPATDSTPPPADPPPPQPVSVSNLPKELMESELLPKYKRDLVAKLKCLRAELNALQPQSGHCRLEVSRNEIFEVYSFPTFQRIIQIVF